MLWVRCLILALVQVAVLGGLQEEWEEYKGRWGKVYSSKEEENRKALWLDNRARVQEHNSGKNGFRMGLGQWSDWSREEVAAQLLGYTDIEEQAEMQTFQGVLETPESVDYRDSGLVTEVKNQGHCGSCWAFSASGGIEGAWAKKVGELLSVSEQQLLDCAPGDCGGGNMGAAFTIAEDGVMAEEDYPYEHKEGDCRFNSSQAVAFVTGFKSVAHNEDDLEKALVQVGYPISIAIHAGSTFQHYEEGIYSDPTCVEGKLNHAVLLVGYNKAGPEPYWIVKNSWGSQWGQSGYGHMRMGENSCGLAKRPVYPIIEDEI